ncbi:hypothetical protein ACOME3_009856 [Neoechinorhynchus agilis]
MMPDDTAGDNLDSVAVVHGGNNQRHCSSNAAVHHQFPNFDPSRMCYPPAPPPNDGIQNGNNEIAAIDIKASSLTVGQLAASNAPLCFYAPQQQQQQQQQPVPQCPSSCNRFIAAQQPPPQQKNLTISLNNARSRGPIGGGGAGALPSTSLDTLDVLAQLDNHPDRQVFVDNLRLIWSEHNIKFRSLPTISKKSIDLYLLYLLVKDRNGFLEVTRKKQWKEVANALGITNCGSAAFGVKRNYSKSGLFFYECRFELNNADPKVVIADYEKQHGTNHSFASAVEGSSSYHTQQQQQRNSPCTAGTGCPSRKRKRTSIPEGGFKSSPESGSAQTPQQSQTVRQPNVNHNSNSMMPKQPPFVPCSSAPSAPMGTSMGNYYPVNTPSSRMMQLDCGTVCQPLTVPPVPSSNNYYLGAMQNH